MQSAVKILSLVENALAVMAALFLALLVISVSYGVIARPVGLPTAWTLDISEYSMLFMTMFAAPWILRHNRHVRVDLVTSMLPRQVRAVLLLITNMAATLGVALLLFYSAETVLDSWSRDVVLRKALDIPQWIVLSAIPVGSLFLTLRFIVDTVDAARAVFDPEQAKRLPELAGSDRDRAQGVT